MKRLSILEFVAVRGGGGLPWECKFVLVAARLEEEQVRVILDLEAVVKPGREARPSRWNAPPAWRLWFPVPRA